MSRTTNASRNAVPGRVYTSRSSMVKHFSGHLDSPEKVTCAWYMILINHAAQSIREKIKWLSLLIQTDDSRSIVVMIDEKSMLAFNREMHARPWGNYLTGSRPASLDLYLGNHVPFESGITNRYLLTRYDQLQFSGSSLHL